MYTYPLAMKELGAVDQYRLENGIELYRHPNPHNGENGVPLTATSPSRSLSRDALHACMQAMGSSYLLLMLQSICSIQVKDEQLQHPEETAAADTRCGPQGLGETAKERACALDAQLKRKKGAPYVDRISTSYQLSSCRLEGAPLPASNEAEMDRWKRHVERDCLYTSTTRAVCLLVT